MTSRGEASPSVGEQVSTRLDGLVEDTVSRSLRAEHGRTFLVVSGGRRVRFEPMLVLALCAACSTTPSPDAAATTPTPGPTGAHPAPGAQTSRPTPSAAAIVLLGDDGRRVRGQDATGGESWSVDIIAQCGEPQVGEPRVRHLASHGHEVHVVYGKHNVAAVRIADGTVTCGRADKAVDPLAGIDPRALALLEKLNSWDPEECDVHERPAAYPNRVPSGETGGWVGSYKRSLAELGYEVVWDAKVRRYLLAPGR